MAGKICKTHYSNSELCTLMYNYEHEKGAFVCFLRGELCGSSNEFFREISTAMRFPYYFGWNWNAFDECITDLEWLTFSSILIVIDSFDRMFKEENHDDECKEYLIRYLKNAAEYWESEGIPMIVYLNQQDDYENAKDKPSGENGTCRSKRAEKERNRIENGEQDRGCIAFRTDHI